MSDKDLFLDSAKRLFRFRVLVRTQFHNKEGEPVRDSLLKPGDQLSVFVNKDDPETALRVVLSRAGTDSERAAAARPFDRDSAKAPVLEDTHGVGNVEYAGESGSVDAGPEPSRPRLEHRTATSEAYPPPDRPDLSGADGALQAFDEIVAEARIAAETLTDSLPNFLVSQWTTRYYTQSTPAQWTALDVVSADVACMDGVEEYRNIQINGKAAQRPVEKTGAWSTVEFVTTLRDILSPMTAAAFTRNGEDQIAGRTAYVYKYSVRKTNSHWKVVAQEGRREAPAYTGALWIDKETHRVLRIEQRATGFSTGFPIDKAEATLDYDFVSIDGKSYLLPVHSENLGCTRGTAQCSRNVIEFRNYRKFAADSTITSDKFRLIGY